MTSQIRSLEKSRTHFQRWCLQPNGLLLAIRPALLMATSRAGADRSTCPALASAHVHRVHSATCLPCTNATALVHCAPMRPKQKRATGPIGLTHVVPGAVTDIQAALARFGMAVGSRYRLS
jgi:hypothetical protein